MNSASTTTTPAGGASAASAVSNAKEDDRICVVCYDDCTCISKKPSSTISTLLTAASTSNLVATPSTVNSTTSEATTQTTASASVAPAATFSSTTNSSTFYIETPSSSPFRAKPASSATTTTNAVLTGPLSRPAPAEPVFSGFGGATGFPGFGEPVVPKPLVSTTGPVRSASTAPATSGTTTGAVQTGLLSSPARIEPVFSGFREATGFASTVPTMTPASPAQGLFSSQAATVAGSTPSITTPKQNPELVAPAATSSSTTTSSKFSGGTPSPSPYKVKPVSAATTTNTILTRRLSRPRLARPPVFPRLGTTTGFVSTPTTTGPVLSSSTVSATTTTTTVAVTAGLVSSPVAANPVLSGSGAANGFTSTVTTMTRISSAKGPFSSQAAGSTPSITTPKQEPDQVVLKVAYPEFYDLDKDKREIYFAVDQVWAIFDNLDHMPRNYVRINKVYSPFKVDVTWLEFVPRDIHENAWKRSGLPVACGKFKPLGKFKYVKSQKNTIEDISSFSHKILKKISLHESYNIYPQKGETWALYKNWNMKWSSDPDNHREYEYELVVVLSDYTKKSGICFDPLVKLKGFVCLFKPTKNNLMASCQIPSNEMLRFSHRVPSYRTDGKKRKDVPEGYFELDIRSLPRNLEEVSEVVDMEAETVDSNINGSLKPVPEEKHPMPKKRKNPDTENTLDKSSPGENKSSRMSNGSSGNFNKEKQAAEASGRPVDKSKASTSVPVYEENAVAHAKEMCPVGVITIPGSVDHEIPFSPSLKIFEMLDTGFCNFDEERSCEKFKAGQIWAVYCKLDELPKSYAQIESVESFPVFKLAVKWLKSCDPPRGIIPWVDKEMPVSCGTFKVISEEVVVFNDSVCFSHQLGVVPAVDNVYTIYPRAGEVWAIYSKFRFDLTCSDLKKCEYDIVEILEVVDVHWIIVSVLERVTGFKTVFKAKEKEELDSTAAIPWIELYRFSHQVPTFVLSGARYGKLRGCWELDPRSLAVY